MGRAARGKQFRRGTSTVPLWTCELQDAGSISKSRCWRHSWIYKTGVHRRNSKSKLEAPIRLQIIFKTVKLDKITNIMVMDKRKAPRKLKIYIYIFIYVYIYIYQRMNENGWMDEWMKWMNKWVNMGGWILITSFIWPDLSG